MNKVIMISMVFLLGALAGISTAGSLIDNGNGTVTDSGTLLMWQQGESSLMIWEDALTTCESSTLAGNTDWRLPNHKELLTLVDFTEATTNAKINRTLFPGAVSSFYWTSTTVAYDTTRAFLVYFYSGSSNAGVKATDTNYARCVRGGV
jgi:hypothetical protein